MALNTISSNLRRASSGSWYLSLKWSTAHGFSKGHMSGSTGSKTLRRTNTQDAIWHVRSCFLSSGFGQRHNLWGEAGGTAMIALDGTQARKEGLLVTAQYVENRSFAGKGLCTSQPRTISHGQRPRSGPVDVLSLLSSSGTPSSRILNNGSTRSSVVRGSTPR